MKFSTYRDSRGGWRWRVVARNGRVVAASSEGFATHYNVLRNWRAFVRAIQKGV